MEEEYKFSEDPLVLAVREHLSKVRKAAVFIDPTEAVYPLLDALDAVVDRHSYVSTEEVFFTGHNGGYEDMTFCTGCGTDIDSGPCFEIEAIAKELGLQEMELT